MRIRVPRRVYVPCRGPITQQFGVLNPDVYSNIWHRHLGIDIGAPEGTLVVAAASGAVLWADWNPEIGYSAVIEHTGGSRTLYAHLSELTIELDGRVIGGHKIGLSGATGSVCEGPHLHFECFVGCTGRDLYGPFGWTRGDPTGLPADPYKIWSGKWVLASEGLARPEAVT